MAKRRPPPPVPFDDDPGLTRGQIILIVSLAVLAIVGGVALLIYNLPKASPPIAQAPTPTYVPPPVVKPPVVEPPPPVPAPEPTTVPSLPPPEPTPPPAIPPTTLPTPPVPPPPPAPKPPIIPPAAPRPPPPVITPAPLPVPPVVQRPVKPPLSAQMQLGNPTNANNGSGNANNFLLQKPYFAVSYNDSHGEPNWVSWTVTADNLGTAKRKQTFDPETTLPSGFRRIVTKDYANSGFDRGHMCPHSDRAGSIEQSYSTFVMSNIIPQSPHCNQKGWARLEDYGRTLVTGGTDICVIAGPLGRGGEGKDGQADTIAEGHVVVPAAVWKIIVVVPPGPGDDFKRITAACRVIAVIMPNDQSVEEPWTPYITTVAEIEAKTGYKFFGTLPANTAAALKTKRDSGGDQQ